MLFIGLLVSILTFPGVMVHEMAHACFCRLFGVKVHQICYFRFGNPAGYVRHEEPENPWHHLFIAIGPFIINSLLAVLIGLLTLRHFTQLTMVDGALFWLGISIAMHAFPSIGDAKSLWRVAWGGRAPFLMQLVSIPLVALIYLISLGSVIWLDLAYGIFLTIFVTRWLLQFTI